jgi:hypothetical protein
MDCNKAVTGLMKLSVVKSLSQHRFDTLRYHAIGLVAVLLPAVLTGCSSMLTSATTRLGENLSKAISNQDDPQTVREGTPAYLLLIDGLIQDDPNNVELLIMGAKLYGTFAATFVENPSRAQRLTTHARDYATRALCQQNAALCPKLSAPYDEFAQAVGTLREDDVATLYAWATASAGWIQAHADDWNAVAELPKVETAMQRVVVLNESFDNGGAHLYLGVLATLRPPALGGKPEEGRIHFERAIAISGGRNLMAKVLFAKDYARLVFDRELHDRLLKEVLAAKTDDAGYTLSNAIAKEQAHQLLATSGDYF